MKYHEYIKTAASIISDCIPSSLLINTTNKIILPTYHTISETPLIHIKNLYKTKNIREFTKDIDFLLKRFTPIDFNSLQNLVSTNKKLSKNYFHLSFDDGLKECCEIISPILKQKGIPATFFLNPSFIDNKGLMHRYKVSIIIEEIKKNKIKRDQISKFVKRKMGIRREASNFLLTLKYPHNRILNEIAQLTETDFESYLKIQQPYMTSVQIDSLIKDGFTLGAHSWDHPEYFMLSEEEQFKQTSLSINYITQQFHLNYKAFAFPFTDSGVSKSFLQNIHNSPNPLCDLSFGVAGIKKDILYHHLQRIPMETRFSGREIIKGEYLYYYCKALANKNTYIRK